ncbi:MAG: PorT family protein [Bacteroidia bacterium]|nr:PorT family protein [Bacteroidia bacterium]
MIQRYLSLAACALFATGGALAQDADDRTRVIKTKRVHITINEVTGENDTTITQEVTVEKDGLDALQYATLNEDSIEAVIEEAMESAERALEEAEVEMEHAMKELEEGEKSDRKSPRKTKVVETSMWVFEWGLNNWISDGNTLDLPEDYSDLTLNKSSNNFHLGIIQQGVNLYKGKLRLVYGAGIEYNTYKFKKPVTISRDVKPLEYSLDENIDYRQNKLVSQYATIPLMLNYKSNPNKEDKSFKLSAGVQFGYLIGAHQKQKWGRGKEKEKKKVKGDYGFEDYRMGYVAQFGYGDFVLFGKYYPTPTFKSGRGPEVNTASVGLVITPF